MRRKAFTLPEALLTTMLCALILGLAGSLIQGYSQMSRSSAAKDQSTLLGQMALERIASEASSAVKLGSPSGSGPASLLQFNKYDPGVDATRVPLILGSLPSAYDPYDASYLANVTYEITGGGLTRQVTNANSTTTQALLADGLIGLSFQLRGGDFLEVQLVLQDYNKTRTLRGYTQLRCLSQVP